MRYIFTFIIFLSLLIAKGISQYPYGITIRKDSKDTDFDHIDKYTFIQRGKVISKIEDYSIDKFYQGDLDRDGIDELIFQSFSGGAHCCYEFHIISLSQNMKKPINIPLGNFANVDFKDLDGDGILEWIMSDDQYSYYMTCFACSAYVQIVINYRDGKLYLRPNLTKRYTRKNLKNRLKQVRIYLDSYGDIATKNQERFSLALDNFLYYFYSGELDNALRVIHEHFSFKNRAVKLLFLLSLSERISNSYFWSQLLKINGLYDNNYKIKDMFAIEEVAKKLFNKLEKMK